ncbi:MAG: MtnX-like HAD-IB family phosphatase [Candidatus Hodarchaeota archaeon]
MKLAILCDFDGTIVDLDTAEFLLNKFAEGNWEIFDLQLERGEITLKECMQKQFSMLKAPKDVMLKELEAVANFRPNFEKFVKYCETHGFPFIIVSAGLDFAIKYFLKLKGWANLIRVHAAKTRFLEDGIEFDFPKLWDITSIDFKEDLVKHFKTQGYKVVYIGDGISDYTAVRRANFSFVIKDSNLANLCKKEEILYHEITDFQEVINSINDYIF